MLDEIDSGFKRKSRAEQGRLRTNISTSSYSKDSPNFSKFLLKTHYMEEESRLGSPQYPLKAISSTLHSNSYANSIYMEHSSNYSFMPSSVSSSKVHLTRDSLKWEEANSMSYKVSYSIVF